MIVINNRYNIDYLKQACDEMDIMSVDINKDILDEQHRIISDAISSCKSKKGKNVGKKIKSEIEKIRKHIDENGTVEFSWQYKNDSMVTYPASFINDKQFGIRIPDAIELRDSTKLVEIELTDILNLIAFEYGRKQLGYDNMRLEKTIDNVGIAGFHDINDVRNSINEIDYAYNLLKNENIRDSEYYTSTGIMQGYFNSTRYNTYEGAKYGSIVNMTCRKISEIIAVDTIERMLKRHKDTALISIGKNSIVIVTDKDVDVKEYVDRHAIKIIGRQFKINTVIRETL